MGPQTKPGLYSVTLLAYTLATSGFRKACPAKGWLDQIGKGDLTAYVVSLESLDRMKMIDDSGKLPLSVKERHARKISKMTEELHQLEIEYHDLDAQQIREELKRG
jgi:hypothetical protein